MPPTQDPMKSISGPNPQACGGLVPRSSGGTPGALIIQGFPRSKTVEAAMFVLGYPTLYVAGQ